MSVIHLLHEFSRMRKFAYRADAATQGVQMMFMWLCREAFDVAGKR